MFLEDELVEKKYEIEELHNKISIQNGQRQFFEDILEDNEKAKKEITNLKCDLKESLSEKVLFNRRLTDKENLNKELTQKYANENMPLKEKVSQNKFKIDELKQADSHNQDMIQKLYKEISSWKDKAIKNEGLIMKNDNLTLEKNKFALKVEEQESLNKNLENRILELNHLKADVRKFKSMHDELKMENEKLLDKLKRSKEDS